MTVNTILVGVDGSEHAGRALAWAIGLAKPLGASIIAVHVIETPSYAIVPYPQYDPFSSEEWLGDVRARVANEWCAPLRDSGVRFETRAVPGIAAEQLIEIADQEEADLIVVGTRGRGGFRELLLGSTSHHLTHHAGRPIVVVPTART